MFRLFVIFAICLPLSAQPKRSQLPEEVPLFDAPLVLTLNQDLVRMALRKENDLKLMAFIGGNLTVVEIQSFQTDLLEPSFSLFSSRPYLRETLDEWAQEAEVIVSVTLNGYSITSLPWFDLQEKSAMDLAEGPKFPDTDSVIVDHLTPLQKAGSAMKSPCEDDCLDDRLACSAQCTTRSCLSICIDEYNFCLDWCQSITDTDSDGIPDSTDNCPNNANPNQADCDNDGIGDVCDGNNWTNPTVISTTTTLDAVYTLGSDCVLVFGFDSEIIDKFQYVYKRVQVIQETNCVTSATRTNPSTIYFSVFCQKETFIPCSFHLYSWFGPFC